MKIDSEKITRLRSERNWTQEKLSEICGLNLRTIQRIETSGKASQESVRLLAGAFEVDPSELIIVEQKRRTTPVDAVKTGFQEFGDFSGKATRFEYWWFFLFVLLLASIATIIHDYAYLIVSVVVLVPLISVGTRRLNDIGRSGWWQLLALVPFGIIVVLYLLTMESVESVG